MTNVYWRTQADASVFMKPRKQGPQLTATELLRPRCELCWTQPSPCQTLTSHRPSDPTECWQALISSLPGYQGSSGKREGLGSSDFAVAQVAGWEGGSGAPALASPVLTWWVLSEHALHRGVGDCPREEELTAQMLRAQQQKPPYREANKPHMGALSHHQ